MDRAEAIKAMKSLQDNLGVDRSEENLTTEAATHDKRTETHGVCSDIISRADIEYHTQLEARGNGQYEEVEVAYKSDIDNLPPADTDMSEYCDRLWNIAYERGKAEGQKQVASKLKKPCDSFLTDDTDDCKEHKSKLDLIRRQAAVGIIDLMLDEDTAELIRGYIEDLPSVTPAERTEWIPVSDRLPEEEKEVLVTVHFMGLKQTHPNGWNDHIKPSYYVDIASRIDEEWSSASDEYKIARNRHKTIAWMPRPEPYKGGDTE